MDNQIGNRIKQLIDYLNLTYNEFSNECGFATYATVKKMVEGITQTIKVASLNKIRQRYPVREEWLFFGKGEMWEEDYFRSRFFKYSFNYKNPQEKMEGLLFIYESGIHGFSRRTNVPAYRISDIKNGRTAGFSEKVKDKIIKTFDYIPESFFD